VNSTETAEMIARRQKYVDMMEHHFASVAPIERIPIPPSILAAEWFNDFKLDRIVKPYAIMGFKFPGFSGKVVGMLGILLGLQERGVLTPETTLIAPTSGNLGFAGGLLAGPRSLVKAFDVKDFIAVVESSVPEAKQAHLQMSGANVKVAPKGMTAIEYAEQLVAELPNAYFVDQYTDINNVLAQRWIAQGIHNVQGSSVSAFVCVTGSMASFVGAHRFLPPLAGSHVKILGVASMPDESKAEKVPGSRSLLEIVEPGFNYRDVPGYKDYPIIENVSKREAAIATDEYVRASISAGFTSGLASAGFYKFLESMANAGHLKELMNPEGDIDPDFLFMDMYLPYATELAKILYGKQP
jgi:cysteine synthase A